jgi:hypothetical protein
MGRDFDRDFSRELSHGLTDGMRQATCQASWRGLTQAFRQALTLAFSLDLSLVAKVATNRPTTDYLAWSFRSQSTSAAKSLSGSPAADRHCRQPVKAPVGQTVQFIVFSGVFPGD